MVVRALTPADVDVYRAIRLEALHADPGAFGSTLEREAAFVDDDWRERLTGGDERTNLILIDEVEGQVLGTAGVTIITADPEPMFVGMWVRSDDRRRGAAGRLLESAIDWTRSEGFDELMLWVVRDNAAAIALYEKFGFVRSGKVDTMPSDPSVEELEMRCSLRTIGT